MLGPLGCDQSAVSAQLAAPAKHVAPPCSHARAQVVSLKGEEYWFKTLETEFGGMNDVRGWPGCACLGPLGWEA